MKHQGEIVEKAVRESGISIVRLAERLGLSRQTVYNIFDNPVVPWDTVTKIGYIINHDFSKEIKPKVNKETYKEAETPSNYYFRDLNEEVTYWKNKYNELLERYRELLDRLAKK